MLPNLIVDERAIPEFIDRDSDPARLAEALLPLLAEGPERAAQLAAFERVRRAMDPGVSPPSVRAADALLETLRAGTPPA